MENQEKNWKYWIFYGKHKPFKRALIPIPFCDDLSLPPRYENITEKEIKKSLNRKAPIGLIKTYMDSDEFGKEFKFIYVYHL